MDLRFAVSSITSSARASSVGADGKLHAIVVEQWTGSEHKDYRQFATLEEPQLDEHPILVSIVRASARDVEEIVNRLGKGAAPSPSGRVAAAR
jgi:hypothetical protein